MNLQDMKGAIILLAVIAFIGSAAAIALNDFASDIGSSISATAVLNESVTAVNATWVALAFSPNTISLSCTEVVNGTNKNNTNVTVGVGNYTCGTEGIYMIDIDGLAHNFSTDIGVSYTYKIGDEAYNTSQSGLIGIANTTGYLGTIGTIIGVAVLIGIVVLAFTFVRR